MTSDVFDNPGTTTALDLKELNGRLLLLKPTRVEIGVSTTLGPKDVTVADVHTLDGPSPEVFGEAFVWPKVLQAQLRSTVGTGRYVLGRLGQGVAKPGQSAPWVLSDPTDAERESARKYLAALAEPVTAPDDEPPPF
jgi:hypothetical protein